MKKTFCTIEASSFGLHRNFGLFPDLHQHQNVTYRTNYKNESYRKTVNLQTWFCSCLAHNSPKKATDLAKIGPNISLSPKLEAFMVISFTVWIQQAENCESCD
jgi:hypothetical protein